jgi:glyoxylase-like metal-dependent hydrolase (beta-lactamase superfamily II)
MQAGQTLGTGRVVEPAPKAALPVVTFSETLTLHANGQTILGTHIPHAHTDGDTIVFFREANVMHTGDAFVNGSYPFVDRSSGGHIDGIIAAAAHVYDSSDANTRIIPGHGPLATRDDVRRFHDMLVTIRDRVATMIGEGKSLAEIQAARPTADFDGQVNADGFVKPDGLVAAIHSSLSEQQ